MEADERAEFARDMVELFAERCRGYGTGVDVGHVLRGVLGLIRKHHVRIDANFATLVRGVSGGATFPVRGSGLVFEVFAIALTPYEFVRHVRFDSGCELPVHRESGPFVLPFVQCTGRRGATVARIPSRLLPTRRHSQSRCAKVAMGPIVPVPLVCAKECL